MGKATAPRLRQSKGGRPRQPGDRYPSGKLRPPKPNEKVLAIRQAFGLDKLGQKFTPIEVAFHRGWVDEETYWAAARYAALYRLAVTGVPGYANQNLLEAPNSVDVRALSFAQLTHAEVTAIWDSAMGEPAYEGDEKRAAQATKRWRETNLRMSTEQRQEVFDVVVLESWPQWIVQRSAGLDGRAWERKRELLTEGLFASGLSKFARTAPVDRQ